MGRVLEFRRKDETDSSIPVADLTPQELHERLLEHTLTQCRSLVEHYKRTGRWSAACETSMITAVQSLKHICVLLSETTS